MNNFPLVSKSVLFATLAVLFSASLMADVCRVLILSPSDRFSAGDIAAQLKILLESSGEYSAVDVTYRDILKDANYATSLIGVAYVPPFRVDHLAAIQQGGWTHVVMIDRPYCYAVAPELHYVAVNALSKVISASGAQPVLMMPWIDRASIDGIATSQALVREYAYRVGDGVRDSLGRSVPVVPAGVAWSTLDPVLRGTLPAQPATGVALNTNGKYAAAASLFHYLTGRNARSVAYLPAGLTSGIRDGIADHVAAVAVSEASSVRYTGEFQSARIRFWREEETLPYTVLGTSTENAIRDQLVKICADDGKTSLDTRGAVVNGLASGRTAAKLVFGRDSNLGSVATYDNGTPVTTMVAGFDRQSDTVSNGPGAAVEAEYRSILLYRLAAINGWNYLPYHLLWVRTMYDLNIPIDPFSIHAPDWQFAAVASALYTQRMNGRNGIFPASAGYVYWSPALRTERFAWQTGQMAWQTMQEMATLKPAPSVPHRPYGLNRIIEAEAPASSSRLISRRAHAVETFQLEGLADGDWTSYRIDFGELSPSVVSAIVQVASTTPGASIEIRAGSPSGELLGTIPLEPGSGPDDFREMRGILSTSVLSGVEDIFLVNRVPGNTKIKLDHFRFSVQARGNESVWILSSPGVWESPSHWLAAPPEGIGSLARFSLDIPGGLPADTAVTLNQSHVLTTLELGHGVGTTGGVRLQNGGSGAFEFQSENGLALIRKVAGGKDEIEVPIRSLVPLQIRNQTNSLLSIRAPISGQEDLFPSGKVNFSGTGYDLGRVGFSTGITHPGNVETAFLGGTFIWNASGVARNFFLPQHTGWTIEGGEFTNLGWTEIGNDDTATSGGNSLLTINGGIFRHASNALLRLGHYFKTSTFITLNGGVFETRTAFTKSAGSVTLTLNGGRLRYTGVEEVPDLFSNGSSSDVITKIGLNGAHFEITEASTVSLQNDLTPVGVTDGGLRKSGVGTLVLTGTSSFKGPIVVDHGELRASSQGALGFANHFTVRRGATLSLPGPLSLGVYGAGSGWVGSGTVNGDVVVSNAPMDLTEGTLSVSGNVSLLSATVSVAPELGATAIDAAGRIELHGTLTLDVRAPEEAIPIGGQAMLISGSERDGEFHTVLGSNLWAVSYTETSVVMTAQANIPGVKVPPVNNGLRGVWGDVVTLTATATDVEGITIVEFYGNGRLIGRGAPGPNGVYSYAWNLSNGSAQTFAITVRVTNLDGVSVESLPQNFVVDRLSGSGGTWVNSSGGTWSSTDNWQGGKVADSYDDVFFDALDIPAGITIVEVDSPRTLGKLSFSDLGASTAGTWQLTGHVPNSLTLSGGAAEIFVAPGGSADVASSLAAPGGFTKAGNGTLSLSVANPGLLGPLSVSGGVLSVGHSGALGAATVNLVGGGLTVPSALTLANVLVLDSEVLSTLTLAAPVTWIGDWRDSSAAAGTTLRLWATASAATANLPNTIFMPGTDLEIAGLSNTVNFSGNVTVRNFKFYGRTGSPQGDLNVTFSGSAVAAPLQSLTTINDGRTTNIRINDQAHLTLPGFSTSGRANFYLNGGTLTVRKLPVGAFSAIFANGGVLRPMASDPQFLFGNGSVRPFNVQAGGLKVDTRGFDVGMVASIVTNANPDGGVTKIGEGTLTVDGTSVNMTWRGPTRVLGGKLRLGSLAGLSSNSRVFQIDAGATLDIASSMTPMLSLGNASSALSGSGTLIGGLSITSGMSSLTAGQPLKVTGNVTIGGGSLVVVGSLTGPGDFVVLAANQVTGTFASVGALPAAPLGFTRQLVYESNRVLVRVRGPGEGWLETHAAAGARFADDADGNGWTLLQEYALGVLPGANTGQRVSVGFSAEGRPQVSFSYNPSAVDATIEVQSSHDLVAWTPLFSKPAGSTTTWTPHAAGAVIEIGNESGGLLPLKITGPSAPGPKTFLRVRISRAE